MEEQTGTDIARQDVNHDSNVNSEGHATRVGEMNDDSHASDHSHAEADSSVNASGKCPFLGGELKQVAGGGTRNRDWWPNQLKLNVLRQHSSLSNPMGEAFNYAEEFKKLDLAAVKQDIFDLMTA